jgi:hypothetical protein
MATTAQVELHRRTLRTGFAEPGPAQGGKRGVQRIDSAGATHQTAFQLRCGLTPYGLVDGADGTSADQECAAMGLGARPNS